MDLGGGCNDLGGGGLSWVKVGARFNNTHFYICANMPMISIYNQM